MLDVAAVFAQLRREMISENTKDGLLRRAEAGLFLGNATILLRCYMDTIIPRS
jgi:DNA invertase Pin-like site-specific DNA recombinase